VVAAPIENADDCHGLIQDGVGDHDALPITDPPADMQVSPAVG
jgi:hypothetical protein